MKHYDIETNEISVLKNNYLNTDLMVFYGNMFICYSCEISIFIISCSHFAILIN